MEVTLDVELHSKLQRFEELPRGSLVIATISTEGAAFGIKARRAGSDDPEEDRIVVLGPELAETPALSIWRPENLGIRDCFVLDRTHALEPSTALGDFCLDCPLGSQAAGIIYCGTEKLLLGVSYPVPPGRRRDISYLDLRSGDIFGRLPIERFMATRRWRVIRRREGLAPEILLEYPTSGDAAAKRG